MATRVVVTAALAALGCGRIGFDAAAAIDARAVDAAHPEPDAAAPAVALGSAFSGGTGTNPSDTIPWMQTAGDLLVVPAWAPDPSDALTVSDSLGQTWTSVPAAVLDAGACSSQLHTYYAFATQTGAVSITAAESGAEVSGFFILEYAGVSPDDPVVAVADAAGAAASAGFAAALTTPADSFVVALAYDPDVPGTMAIDPPFAARSFDQTGAVVADDAPGVAPGTVDFAGALPGSASDACWQVQLVAFRAP